MCHVLRHEFYSVLDPFEKETEPPKRPRIINPLSSSVLSLDPAYDKDSQEQNPVDVQDIEER